MCCQWWWWWTFYSIFVIAVNTKSNNISHSNKQIEASKYYTYTYTHTLLCTSRPINVYVLMMFNVIPFSHTIEEIYLYIHIYIVCEIQCVIKPPFYGFLQFNYRSRIITFNIAIYRECFTCYQWTECLADVKNHSQ